MKAVTCPQCGSLISKISEYQNIVQCDYCNAKVIVADQGPLPKFDERVSDHQYQLSSNASLPKTGMILIALGITFCAAIALLTMAGTKVSTPPPEIKQSAVTVPTFSPPEKPEKLSVFEFGGKGTSPGLFDNPGEITVDASGNIYVSDETLRVQRFDANGKFLNLWNVEGKKNETIDKIADGNGEIYVLIAGRIVVYDPETGAQKHILTDSQRHYIDDFVLRDDGGLMYIAENSRREEIVQTKGRAIVKRFDGIHSAAAETDLPARCLRLAIDGRGDIYSVYALGDTDGEFSYNDEDLMTFKFSPEGKFINKFAADLMPKAILTDNQGRVYILDAGTGINSQIIIFSGTGSEITRLTTADFQADAMALDKQNSIYTISGDKVVKLKPVNLKISFGGNIDEMRNLKNHLFLHIIAPIFLRTIFLTGFSPDRRSISRH